MSLPRVLVVHNSYRQPGGEDAVVDAEIGLLRGRGHSVETYVRSNDELNSMHAQDAFAQALWSRRSWSDVTRILAAFRPDVLHVHNTFARVSPSIHWAAARAGIPVVQTLHNFRLLCVQAMFLRQGRVCEDCLGRLPWRGVARNCYRGSRLQSAGLATAIGAHRALGTYRRTVARYIALTAFCRDKFIEGGLPGSRIAVKPNFVDIARAPESPRRGGLFVGRLSPEKGIHVLLEALRELPGITLDVIGDGPERDRVAAHPQINLLGWLAPAAVYARMREAAYLVMPSVWYENFPRTLVEAFASGLPVVASRIGSLAELVDHGRTGLVFEPGAARDFARHVAWAEAFPAKMRAMGENARDKYERAFTPEKNYDQLMAIYDDAMAAGGPEKAAWSARGGISRTGASVIGSHVDALGWDACLDRVLGWASRRESRYVCLCNAHSVVTARREPAFARAIGAADLVVADGAPVAWRLRTLGFPGQPRLSGPDLMRKCCERAASEGIAIFLYGGTAATLRRLSARLAAEFPNLVVAGCYAPPYRELTAAEDEHVTHAIRDSGAQLVFVGLGCPRQETWMAAHRGSIDAVMLGVGAAFDFYAGTIRRAPRWMQHAGLEWLHRLCSEPRRLWRRYLVTNALFIAYLAGEVVTGRRPGEDREAGIPITNHPSSESRRKGRP
jgi:exopolysaccharide biosynthesis WecB/TagA/CpsF family protein